MTKLSHAVDVQRLVPDRAAVLADDDRRRAPLRLARAEAERDLARRRRLFDRAAAERACLGAIHPAQAPEATPAHTGI